MVVVEDYHFTFPLRECQTVIVIVGTCVIHKYTDNIDMHMMIVVNPKERQLTALTITV